MPRYDKDSKRIFIKIALDADGCLLDLQNEDNNYRSTYQAHCFSIYNALLGLWFKKPEAQRLILDDSESINAQAIVQQKFTELRGQASYEASQKAMAELSPPFINYLIKELELLESKNSDKTFVVEFISGSARKSLSLEKYNSDHNANGYFFPALMTLKEQFENKLAELKIQNVTVNLNLSCYADELCGKPRGHSFSKKHMVEYEAYQTLSNKPQPNPYSQLPEEAVDTHKVFMVVRHVNEMPSTNEQGNRYNELHYMHFDDRPDIHNAVWQFLQTPSNQTIINDRVTIHLYNFHGSIPEIRFVTYSPTNPGSNSGLEIEQLALIDRLLGFLDCKPSSLINRVNYTSKARLLSEFIVKGFPKSNTPFILNFSPLKILGHPDLRKDPSVILKRIIEGIEASPFYSKYFCQTENPENRENHLLWNSFKNLFLEIKRLLSFEEPLIEAIREGNLQKTINIITEIINPYLPEIHPEILKDLAIFGLDPYLIILGELELQTNSDFLVTPEEAKKIASMCFTIHQSFPIYHSIAGNPDDWQKIFAGSYRQRLIPYLPETFAKDFDKLLEQTDSPETTNRTKRARREVPDETAVETEVSHSFSYRS